MGLFGSDNKIKVDKELLERVKKIALTAQSVQAKARSTSNRVVNVHAIAGFSRAMVNIITRRHASSRFRFRTSLYFLRSADKRGFALQIFRGGVRARGDMLKCDRRASSALRRRFGEIDDRVTKRHLRLGAGVLQRVFHGSLLIGQILAKCLRQRRCIRLESRDLRRRGVDMLLRLRARMGGLLVQAGVRLLKIGFHTEKEGLQILAKVYDGLAHGLLLPRMQHIGRPRRLAFDQLAGGQIQ